MSTIKAMATHLVHLASFASADLALFLDRKICFLEIYDLIQGAMEHHQVIENPSVEQILEAEAEAYEYIMRLAQ